MEKINFFVTPIEGKSLYSLNIPKDAIYCGIDIDISGVTVKFTTEKLTSDEYRTYNLYMISSPGQKFSSLTFLGSFALKNSDKTYYVYGETNDDTPSSIHYSIEKT